MNSSVLGLPWYASEEDFKRLRPLFKDVDPAITYKEWLVHAEKFERTRSQTGLRIVRAVLKYPDFVEWCDSRKLKFTARTLTVFARDCVASKRESPGPVVARA